MGSYNRSYVGSFPLLGYESYRSILFDELRNKRLLLIGNAHPDWLARFFVRLARRDRLYSGNDAREFVADGAVVADARLRDFLENFSPQTKSFGVASLIEFVDQLAERWDAFPDKPVSAAWRPLASRQRRSPPRVLSATPARIARRWLQASLGRAGLEVWFDKGRLESGDPWWPVIDQNIATCDVFVPVLSANTNKRDEGHLHSRKESRAGWRRKGAWSNSARNCSRSKETTSGRVWAAGSLRADRTGRSAPPRTSPSPYFRLHCLGASGFLYPARFKMLYAQRAYGTVNAHKILLRTRHGN